MAKIAVKNLKGKKVEEIELNPDIFEVKANDTLLHQVYVALHANRRGVIAHTKTRSERTGSTAKPWRQKGTGRARTGSVKNPIWRKGGVTFGPSSERNFHKKINRRMNKQAIRMVLSGKVNSKEMTVVDDYELENNKTKEMAKALENLKINKKALLVFTSKEKDSVKSSRNISFVSNTTVDSLNVFDMLNNKHLVISKNGIEEVEERMGEGKVKGNLLRQGFEGHEM